MEESEKARRKHWRECPVSGDALEKPTEAIEANGTVNMKRWENPERFGRQGRLGKGAWADTSKEHRGIPRQFALCALLRAPEPRVDPTY